MDKKSIEDKYKSLFQELKDTFHKTTFENLEYEHKLQHKLNDIINKTEERENEKKNFYSMNSAELELKFLNQVDNFQGSLEKKISQDTKIIDIFLYLLNTIKSLKHEISEKNMMIQKLKDFVQQNENNLNNEIQTREVIKFIKILQANNTRTR